MPNGLRALVPPSAERRRSRPVPTGRSSAIRSRRSEPVAHEFEEPPVRIERAEDPRITIEAMAPTVRMYPPGASKAISVNPAAANCARTAGVASGGRRCRVQTTFAPRRQNAGNARMVATMSSPLTFPKIPHTKTRSAGTNPA